MSNEPVAKRTRQSFSLVQDEINTRRRELQKQVRELYNTMMTNYNKASNSMSLFAEGLKTNRKCLMTQKCIGLCCSVPTCHCMKLQFQLELGYKKRCTEMRIAQREIWNTRLLIDHTSIEYLHPHNCTGRDECVLKMQKMLKMDPLSLERKQFVHPSSEITPETIRHRCSPLHHAIRLAHVKCVKFLLERGANVASITTYENYTVLQTLYDPSLCIFEQERFDILNLLLKYGVSDMMQYDQSGQYALGMLPVRPENFNEFSLLLNHGASMDRMDSRTAIVEACERFLLSLLKLFLLHHPKRLNFGPGSYVLCKKFIENCYWKMVLPGVPSNEYHEKVLEALQFYKTFGGKFPVYPTNDPNQDLMQFLKIYKHRKHFNAIKSEIKALVSNPLSLQEISRLAVRKYIRRNYVESIKELPLPRALQCFLRFDDITITELPEEFDEFGDDEYTSSDGSEDEEHQQ